MKRKWQKGAWRVLTLKSKRFSVLKNVGVFNLFYVLFIFLSCEWMKWTKKKSLENHPKIVASLTFKKMKIAEKKVQLVYLKVRKIHNFRCNETDVETAASSLSVDWNLLFVGKTLFEENVKICCGSFEIVRNSLNSLIFYIILKLQENIFCHHVLSKYLKI